MDASELKGLLTSLTRPIQVLDRQVTGLATAYLENYLGWFRALDRASKNRLKVAPMLALAVGLGEHH